MIPPVVIVPSKKIIASWLSDNITGHEVIIISESGYINKGIYMVWLDHFIKYNNCRPDKPWRILLLNNTTCYKTLEFIVKAKANKI
jgi:hypothetical protein